MRTRVATIVVIAYVWLAIVAFGGILVETTILYPNVFHDPPDSLELSMEFMVATGPADFFPRVGAVTVLAGVATLVLVRKVRAARYWIGGSLISLLLGEFLFSALYFWPRNEIMFEQGIAEHSVEFLRRTAAEFESGHWIRLAASCVTAVLVFAGFLAYHRARDLVTTTNHAPAR